MQTNVDLNELHAAAITAGLDRDTLLSGIDRRFLASIPRASSRGAQLLTDLHELQNVGQLSDGTWPLRTWLQNAVRLSQLRQEERIFRKALDRIDPGAPAVPSAVEMPSPAADGAKLRLYISASPADRPIVERLRRHLSPLKARGVHVWDRTQVDPGAHTSSVAETMLTEADLVVSLLSADYLADQTVYRESERARAPGSRARLVPVLARPCSWEMSPLLKGLQILPRSGKAVTTHSDVDSAFVAIVQDISAIVADLERTQAPPPDRHVEAPRKTGIQAATPGTPLTAVFPRSGDPSSLYVEPAQARRIRLALRTPGRGLVIEGPSKIGKSTTLHREIGKERQSFLDAYSSKEEDVHRVIDAREIDGLTVIDNAHHLPGGTLEKLARRMRVEADNRAPRGKIVLAGIPGLIRRLTATQRDLVGRFDEVRMQRQPDEKIREMIDLAEAVTRLRFQHKEEIVRASRGSFQLAQELCFGCALASGVDDVPGEETPVAKSVADVRPEVQQALAGQFADLALAFVKADEHTDTPGAGLAFLWTLSRTEEDGVPLAKLLHEYPALKPAWDFWQQAGHEPSRRAAEGGSAGGKAGPDLREVAQLVSGRLVSEDPLFRFYLQGLGWDGLAETAGIQIEWQSDGKLLVPVQETPGKSGSTEGRRSLYDHPSYPFWNDDAVKLRDLLTGAYPTIAEMTELARTVKLHLGRFEPGNGAAEPAWNSLLDVAIRQGRLQPLMKKVLEDPNVRPYHDSILEILKNLDAVPPET